VPRAGKLQREVDASRSITHRDRELREARGDVWLGARNVTATSGAFEREAALSPDGTRIAYWSDATGEYQLYVHDGTSATRLTNFTSGFRYRPVWSRDGKKLAFTDQRGAVFVCDLASRAVTEIDRDVWAEQPELAWSADATSLVYTKTAPNRLGTLWRYDVATGQRQQLTSERFNASTPAFAPDGEHLFFISYRNFASPLTDWISQRFVHRAMPVIMAVPLRGTSFDDVERRAFRLTMTPGAITSLTTTDTGDPRYGLTDLAGAQSVRVFRMREKKEEVVADEATPPPPMKVTVDLRAEWRQILDDVVRNYRDFFHAPKVPLPDWTALHRKYLPLIERCDTREEVNVILGELAGEVSVGHAYVANGGDVTVPPPSQIGMPGADFALENGAFRITRIYEGAPWDDTVRSPLVGVREGEYLLAVDGEPLDTNRDPRAAFVADKTATITVGPNPKMDERARQVTVTPLADENPLRYRAWVERNRRYIDERSQGRIGYIHFPDFATNGVNEFARQYYGQTSKEALILDARWSQGGSFGSHFAELLDRRHFNSAAIRESEHAWPVPRWGAHFGRKALIVSHMTVSAGENFALYFRKLALGPIIGTRTWGGLTGLNPVPSLIDGGYVNVPNAPFFDETGWLIEGHGLEPDVVAEGDAALDAAIAAVSAK
jgi:tricorn protease